MKVTTISRDETKKATSGTGTSGDTCPEVAFMTPTGLEPVLPA